MHWLLPSLINVDCFVYIIKAPMQKRSSKKELHRRSLYQLTVEGNLTASLHRYVTTINRFRISGDTVDGVGDEDGELIYDI